MCVCVCAKTFEPLCAWEGGMIFVADWVSNRTGRNKSTNFQRCQTIEVEKGFSSNFQQEVLKEHIGLALK